MAFVTDNLLLHIKRVVYTTVRLGCQSACDYPVVLGAGVLLLFLHKVCPSLFAFLLSSTPVFLITALLLGALLSYGEPCAPVIAEETSEDQQTLSHKSRSSASDCPTEVENVSVEAYAEKRFESQAVCTEDRTFDGIFHDTHQDEGNASSVATDAVLCAESSEFARINTVVDREEQTKEIDEKIGLQEFESTNTERCHIELQSQYQLGELMSSCWQPVMRQDPGSDSDSDFSGSSSGASMTDIIPMLDELNPPVNLGPDHPSSTFRGNLNSSSDDDEDESEEDGDLSSNEDEEAEEKNNDANNWKHHDDVYSVDTEKNDNSESLMERRRAKNILRFELDKKLMDMQAADAVQNVQEMEEASRFHVRVPSISTPRPNLSGPSNGSEETVELPQIPDSAPSVLLPWRKPFDIPFNQLVDRERKMQETWTPRSYFPSTQHRKHGNLYVHQSSYLQHRNGAKPGKPELGGENASDGSHSGSDSEQTGSNGMLFGSMEAHLGEEIKILSAAISDAFVLETNYGINGCTKNTKSSDERTLFCIQKSISNSSETKDSDCAGSEQSELCSLSKENYSEPDTVETPSISEVNSVFKCRMEEVLVQSIAESGVGQPLTVKLEDKLSGTSSADYGMPVTEVSSAEELNSEFAQLNEKKGEVYRSTCEYDLIQETSSETLPAANGHASELPIEDASKEVLTLGDEQTRDNSELHVIEPRSIDDIDKFIMQHCEEVQRNDALELHFPLESEQPGYISDLHVLEASSVDDLTAAFKKVHGEVEMHSASGAEEIGLVKEIEEAITDSTLDKSMHVKVESKPANGLLTEDVGLPVLEASSLEEMDSLFKQLEGEAQALMYSSSEHKFDQDEGRTSSDMLVLEAKCIEEPVGQLIDGHDKIKMPQNDEVNLDEEEFSIRLHDVETETTNGDDSFDSSCKLVTELSTSPGRAGSVVVEKQAPGTSDEVIGII